MAMKQKQKSSVLPIFLTILVILLVAVGIWMWLSPNGEDTVAPTQSNSSNETTIDLASSSSASNSTNARIVATFKEGELIQLRQNIATSPDGSAIKYSYSKPLDANGKWQTAIGDAGIYTITITADDGRLKTIRTVGIEVKAVNRAPVISNFDDVTVKEGDLVKFKPVVSDHENDTINLTLSGWMKSESYKTTFTDAGKHTVTLTATDGLHTVSKNATVTVTNVNQAPVLEALKTVTVEEEQQVALSPVYYDADAEQKLVVTYTKPVDASGKWTPKVGDADKYDVTVSVTDGEATVSQPVQIVVTEKNLAPTITNFSNVAVDENTTLRLSPVVADPNSGNKVTVSYSGWMNSSSKDVKFGDAGMHNVTLTATDGKLSTSKTIVVTVNKVYRAPVFVDDEDLFQ